MRLTRPSAVDAMGERTVNRRFTRNAVMTVGSALAIAAAGCGAKGGSERPQTVIECLRSTDAHVSAIPAGFGDPPTIHLAHAADTAAPPSPTRPPPERAHRSRTSHGR